MPSGFVNPNAPINWQCPWNRGLVSWWMNLPAGMWGGGRTWRDLNRSSLNDGTLTNMAFPATSTSGWGPTTRPGGFGEVRFDGTNDYVDMGDVLDIGTNDLTVSAWINCTLGNSAIGMIVEKARLTAQDYRWSFYVNARKLEVFMKGNGGSDVVVTGTTNVNDGAWHYVEAVFQRSGSVTIYLDGASEASGSISAWAGQDFQSINPLLIGAEMGADNVTPSLFFQGAMDCVRVEFKARSAAERLAIRNDTRDYCRRSLNWVQTRVYSGSAGNRRRRYLTLGVA